MAGKLLAIVLLWPLLMPPGFCVCRLRPLPPRAATPEPAADQAEASSPPCSCCQERSSSRSTRVQSTDPTDPTSDQHSPGCPAHPTWSISRAVTTSLLPVGADLVLDAVLLDAGNLLLTLSLERHPPEEDGGPVASPPVYLLCCALRC